MKRRSAMRTQRAPWLVAMAVASACAVPAARPDPLARRFARADAQQARRLAPDLYGRAERARAQALAEEEDEEARADFAQRAQWLLAAAVAEARRIELERAAADAEARAARAAQARAQLERERLAVEHQIRREQTGRDERAHAARVFAGDAGAARAGTAQADAALLLRRAQVLLGAASGLGLPDEQASEVAAAIAAAERAAPGKVLAAARAALREAERAVGAARARTPGAAARAEETAALLEMAQERGLAAQATARGVALGLGEMFAAGSAQLSARGRARLVQVAALAAAHPRGALVIEYPAQDAAADAAAQRLAHARARRVQQALATGDARPRLALAPAPDGEPLAEAPRLLFAAYASGS